MQNTFINDNGNLATAGNQIITPKNNIVGDVTGDLTGNLLDTDYIQFDTNYSNGKVEGRMSWDSDDGTLCVGMPGGDVKMSVGQEMYIPRAKAIGGDIDNGQLVYISGGVGASPKASLAQSDLLSTSIGTIAMATEDVTENQFGFFTAFGLVRDVNTNSYPEGTILYLSPTVAGGYTNIKPLSPNYAFKIGIVIRQHQNEGIIFANISQSATLFTDIYGLTAKSIPFADDNGFLTQNNVNLNYANNKFHQSGGRSVGITDIDSATYNVLITDRILNVSYTTTAAVTNIEIPSAQITDGRLLLIKDAGGNALNNNITITTEGSETIENNDSYVINEDFAWVELYCFNGNVYIKNQGVNIKFIGEGVIVNGSEITIYSQDEWHMVENMTPGDIFEGLEFEAGFDGVITSFADAGGGFVTVTSNNHGLDSDDYISLVDTTNYNGLYKTYNVTENTFDIQEAFLGTETGVFIHGTHTVIPEGAGGKYELVGSIGAAASGANVVFDFAVAIGITVTDIISRKFGTAADVGAAPLTGGFVAKAGDHLSIVLRNTSNSTDITIFNATFLIKRI